MLVSFIIPCLNESRTIVDVINECHKAGKKFESYEIIVSDNGSNDGSQNLSTSNGAIVVNEKVKGYGAALKNGIKNAKGKFIIMGDGDKTYDFTQAYKFIKLLDNGFDLVVGNRFKGQIQAYAMPPLHFYLGNPVLSALGRLFFGINIGDFHCGLRAFKKESILKLNMECDGMEFASEMLIKASLLDLNITEIPTILRRGYQGRKAHLRTWRDGWRHLKYMLSFAPRFSLLPFSIVFLFIATLLLLFYSKQYSIFGGSNTLLISLSCFILSLNIISDYVLSREIILCKYRKKSLLKFDRLSGLLGLDKGTDRLFKYSLLTFLGALFFGVRFYLDFLNNALSSFSASINGFGFSLMIVFCIILYLTATKISTFRSLYLKK